MFVESEVWHATVASASTDHPIWLLGSGVVHDDCRVFVPSAHSHFLPLHTQLLTSASFAAGTATLAPAVVASCLQM